VASRASPEQGLKHRFGAFRATEAGAQGCQGDLSDSFLTEFSEVHIARFPEFVTRISTMVARDGCRNAGETVLL
jgi:hypothetical protein